MSDIHPAIADHYQGMNVALHERDELREKNNGLQNELTIAKGMVEYLTTKLDDVTRDRDHYMRYSFGLTTRINAMQDIWSGMMDLAKHEADNQLPAQLPKAVQIEGSGE